MQQHAAFQEVMRVEPEHNDVDIVVRSSCKKHARRLAVAGPNADMPAMDEALQNEAYSEPLQPGKTKKRAMKRAASPQWEISKASKKKALKIAAAEAERLQQEEELFNNHKKVSPQALDYIDQRQSSNELDNPITWKEFERAVDGMRNDKSPGANNIPCEAFKAMDETNRMKVFEIIIKFWEGKINYAS